MPFLNFLISSNLKKRISKFHFDSENPLESQNNTLINLLNKAKNTSYGKNIHLVKSLVRIFFHQGYHH